MQSSHVSVTIERDPADVYAYLADPANLPEWAAGLGAVRQVEGEWVVESDAGRIPIRFAPTNELGVVDHWIAPPGRREIHIPMRVVPNGDDAEVTFLLFRQPGMSEDAFDADRAAVEADLERLKRVLEPPSPNP